MRGKSLSSERRRRRRSALYEKTLTATYGTRGKEVIPPAGHRHCKVRGLEPLAATSSSSRSIWTIDPCYAMTLILARSGSFSHFVLHMLHCRSGCQQSGLYGNVYPRPWSFPVLWQEIRSSEMSGGINCDVPRTSKVSRRDHIASY